MQQSIFFYGRNVYSRGSSLSRHYRHATLANWQGPCTPPLAALTSPEAPAAAEASQSGNAVAVALFFFDSDAPCSAASLASVVATDGAGAGVHAGIPPPRLGRRDALRAVVLVVQLVASVCCCLAGAHGGRPPVKLGRRSRETSLEPAAAGPFNCFGAQAGAPPSRLVRRPVPKRVVESLDTRPLSVVNLKVQYGWKQGIDWKLYVGTVVACSALEHGLEILSFHDANSITADDV